MSCPACFTGAVHHNEKPTGKQATVHGLPTYIAEPPNGAAPKGIIVITPDAFGLPFINNQILADNHASKGQFRVYLPDFMDGQPAPTWMMQTFFNVFATKTLWNWIRKPYDIGCAMYGFLPFVIRNTFSKSMPKVTAFHHSRSQGGRHNSTNRRSWLLLARSARREPWLRRRSGGTGKPLVDVSFTAHPSNLPIPDDLKPVKKPLAVAIGDNDKVLPLKQAHEIEAALKVISGLKSELVYYPGAGHGFAVRADPGNEKQSQQAKVAENQAVKFFSEAFQYVKH